MKKTLVIGASDNTERYSNKAVKSLLNHQHDVVAIGQKETEIYGIKVIKNQESFTGIDTVTLYLNPTRQKEYYNYIIALKPKRVVFNPGTENPEFYPLLRENNIEFEEACTLVLLATNQY